MAVVRSLFARIWLTMIIGGQVLIAPAVAFAITYLVEIDTQEATLSIQLELMPWILSAALAYGIISFILALVAGGFMPLTVADSGGWLAQLRLSNRYRNPEAVDSARERLRTSPFGRMIRIVHEQVQTRRRGLLEVHGGLQILAAPMQVILVLVPVIAMQYAPDSMIADGHLFEFGLMVYFIGLMAGFRIYPLYAARFVGAASTLRMLMEKVTKLTWTLPVLILWLIVRVLIGISFNWLGIDMENWQSLAVEKRLIESLLPVEATVPESSFIDMLVALSVLPIATFTTITVLGGGAIAVPRWMQDPANRLVEIETSNEEIETVSYDYEFDMFTPSEEISEPMDSEPNTDAGLLPEVPIGGLSGWVASQVAGRLEARKKAKE
ncbi:MAG TPA: hypothetical protein HA330_00800 [Candidatus Thalassarchaeaceae archaeon]|nr:MAG TPA: hypothetical protein D7H85_00810 [Candidatus Poseidoniales archaeon]HII48401.1 hypothetical protein [Candidatus Thalassarchaeaceae archaeon]